MFSVLPSAPDIRFQRTRDRSPPPPIPAKNTVARQQLLKMMKKVDELEAAAKLQKEPITPPTTPRASLAEREFHTPTKALSHTLELTDDESANSERCISVDSSPQPMSRAMKSLSLADDSVSEEEGDNEAEKSVDRSFDEDDFEFSKDPFKKGPPAAPQKPKPKYSPVQAFVERVSKTTPEKPLCSFSPMSRDLANRAIASAKKRPVEAQDEAWKRLHAASIDGLKRSTVARVLNYSKPLDESQVVAVENLDEMKGYWSGELLQIIGRNSKRGVPGSYTFDATHMNKFVNGQGLHYLDKYLHGSWIHSHSKVWCTRITVPSEKENEDKGYKYSTLLPISYKSQGERTALISKALSDPSFEIAKDKKISLYQIPTCPFALEIVKCEGFILTVIPVMEYLSFDPKTIADKVLSYDLYTDEGVYKAAYTVALSNILPDVREGLKNQTLKARYTGPDFIIVDVAPLLKECPIEKGILVQFSKKHLK